MVERFLAGSWELFAVKQGISVNQENYKLLSYCKLLHLSRTV